MRSVTSCFNLTLYKKDLSRFWPLWALYTVIWLFLLPFNMLSSSSYNYNFDPANWAGREPVQLVGNGAGLAIAVVYGLLCAAAVWSFLYNNRSANLMHALPVRREGHFLTHTLAGVTFFALPHAVIFVLTLLTELFCGAVNLGVLATAMAAQTLMCLFFFCFATLCAMLTGHILGLPAFYGIFNLIVYVMSLLLEWLCTFFLYGYADGIANSSALVRALTPVWLLSDKMDARVVYELDHATGLPLVDPLTGSQVRAGYYRLAGMSTLALLALVGLVMLAAALLLYRKRHMESAGDAVSVPALHPVFLYCMGICGSLAGGAATYLVLGMESLFFLVISLAVWGVIFYFAALMLLQKSFRVFRQGWWGCGISLCAVFALCGVLQADLFGSEARVPDADSVVSVSFSAFDTVPYDRGDYIRGDTEDPEAIAKVIAVHQAIVDDRRYLQDWQEKYTDRGYNFTAEQQQAYSEGLAQDGRFSVTYDLKNGSQLSRTYSYLWLEYGSLGDPTSLEARFTELANDRTVLAERYRINDLADSELLSVAITDPGTYNCVFLKTPHAKLDFSAPYYYPTEDSEAYERYLQEFGLTAEEVAADPALAEKFLADDMELITVEQAGGVITQLPDRIQAHLTEGTLTEAQAEAIRRAVLDDFYAGNLGVRYLFNGDPQRQDNTFLADLELTFEATFYEYYYEDGIEVRQTKPYTSTESFKITLTPQAGATIAALRAAGAFAESGVELRTNSGILYNP